MKRLTSQHHLTLPHTELEESPHVVKEDVQSSLSTEQQRYTPLQAELKLYILE
ncbi:hypothetical protein Tco_0934471, partial [Tanacetum coccineum]